MLRKFSKESMGKSNLGWLESRFHFSFAEYRDYERVNFGVLRVLNDDIIHPQSGFGMHPHHDMEIVSYVVRGEITHKDSLGNEEALKRGEVQYMSAGSGVMHSEYNMQADEDLRLLQMWILPPQKNLKTLYGSHAFSPQERQNTLLHIVSKQGGSAPIELYQDVNVYVSELDEAQALRYEIAQNRQIYFVQIEGTARINGVSLSDGDALEVTQERELIIEATKRSHILFIEMANLYVS